MNCPICNEPIFIQCYTVGIHSRKVYKIGCRNTICPNFINNSPQIMGYKSALSSWNARSYDGRRRRIIPLDDNTFNLFEE